MACTTKQSGDMNCYIEVKEDLNQGPGLDAVLFYEYSFEGSWGGESSFKGNYGFQVNCKGRDCDGAVEYKGFKSFPCTVINLIIGEK
jgi:hypothetical protein